MGKQCEKEQNSYLWIDFTFKQVLSKNEWTVATRKVSKTLVLSRRASCQQISKPTFKKAKLQKNANNL